MRVDNEGCTRFPDGMRPWILMLRNFFVTQRTHRRELLAWEARDGGHRSVKENGFAIATRFG